MDAYRVETDLLGEKKLPADTYYGIFTQRAIENFQITGQKIHPLFIKTLAQIKKAAAETNHRLGYLEDEHASAIIRASQEIIEGKHMEHFPLDTFQAGAGTPWNMNINEVIANIANKSLGKPLGKYNPIHPNDHVNLMQSSNDIIPNAIRLTSINLLNILVESIKTLEHAFTKKSVEFKEIMKSGRTHTRDATPITLGQEMKAYSHALKNARKNIETTIKKLSHLHLGGTAVGTGLNTDPKYPETILEILRENTNHNLVQSENLIEKTQFPTDFQETINALACLSTIIIKINNDLMILSSGPMTGLNEITLPEVEPGSSIMPGKINPSILESANMVCFQVLGSRTTIEHACSHGHLELNVYTPMIAYNLFNSITWLTNTVENMRKNCIEGINANIEQTEKYYRNSNATATLLTPIIGYDAASRLAEEANKLKKPVMELAIERGLITEKDAKTILSRSTKPNMSKKKSSKTNLSY